MGAPGLPWYGKPDMAVGLRKLDEVIAKFREKHVKDIVSVSIDRIEKLGNEIKTGKFDQETINEMNDQVDVVQKVETDNALIDELNNAVAEITTAAAVDESED